MESNDSPEIPDRGEISDIPGLPSGDLGQNNPKHVYTMKTLGTGERVTLGPSIVEMDLGVLVDADLKFSKHVEAQVNKANRTLGLNTRSFQFLNRESMKLLFTALV